MKIVRVCLVVMAFCTYGLPAFASGVLVDATGSVTITMPGGKNTAAKTGAELPDGAKISVGKGSNASVMMMDGSIEEIGANQNFTVGGNQKAQGKKTVIDGIALAMNEVSSTGAQPTVHGMVKMGRMGPGEPKPTVSVGAGLFGPEAIYPVETTIDASNEISFLWKYNAKFNFKDPVLVINDANQKQIGSKKISPQSGRLTVNSINLPAGNKYSWYFASDEKGKIQGKSRRFNFRIISSAEKHKLDADIAKIQAFNMSDDGKKFLTAQLYYRQQMIDSMVKELVPVWKNNQSDAVKKLLFYGYSRMGQPEEAKKYQ